MNKNEVRRQRRHYRLRKRVMGTSERPRVSVHRSLKHISVQFIDDATGRTLAASSSHVKEFPEGKFKGMEIAEKVGKLAADAAKKVGIKKVVFDRGGFRYHGKIKVVAETLRKGGLEF